VVHPHSTIRAFLLQEKSGKLCRCQRGSGEMSSASPTVPLPRAPADLRRQAARARHHADYFAGDPAEKRLRELAAELDAIADVLEEAGPG
jgi:hypothetical protein